MTGKKGSDILGATGYTFTCEIKIPVKKGFFGKQSEAFTRLFGNVDVILWNKVEGAGGKALADATLQLISTKTEQGSGMIPLPDWKFQGDAKYSSFPLAKKASNFNISKAKADLKGFGVQEIKSEMLRSPIYMKPDILRLTLTVDVPTALLPKDALVYQYVQLSDPKQDRKQPKQYMTIGCRMTAGKPGSEVVENFEGVK